MAIEVFNRVEKKFIITDEEYRCLIPKLQEHMASDFYSRNGDFYTISNIYYDTVEHDLIRKSIDKPIYKEKLRLRSYGAVKLEDKVYLEIKKKFMGQVNKRRISLTLQEAYHFLETKQKPTPKNALNAQIINEIDYLINRYTLKPTLYLSYDRNAMFGNDDKDLRITFDTNILTRRYDLGLEHGVYGDLLLPPGYWIMEIKAMNAFPLWLTELLSMQQIYSRSFSKYGTEYIKTILHKDTVHTIVDNIRQCV